MKKITILAIIIFLLYPQLSFSAPNQPTLAEKLAGKILLQVESYGRAWYVYPPTKTRYYLKNGEEAYSLMRTLGLGITNANLAQIPTSAEEQGNPQLVERLKGYILLQVESRGQAWYVNPSDRQRYYLKDGTAAYNLMRQLALGITNDNLRQIPINDQQIVWDGTSESVAYIKYNNEEFSHDYNADTILPLASLTKLITALVFIDTNPDWQKEIMVKENQINYPALYAKEEKTSEIDLQVGDKITTDDLFTALLVASSNQAAIILANASGYSRPQFVQKMNQKAQDLGLKKTIFFEPSGLDAHNVSTAREMATIAKTAFADPKIADTLKINNCHLSLKTANNTAKQVSVKNRNYSLLQFQPVASKTGYLIEAQRTAALKKDNNIIVILHANSMSERNGIISQLFN